MPKSIVSHNILCVTDDTASHHRATCGFLGDLHEELDALVAKSHGWEWALPKEIVLERRHVETLALMREVRHRTLGARGQRVTAVLRSHAAILSPWGSPSTIEIGRHDSLSRARRTVTCIGRPRRCRYRLTLRVVSFTILLVFTYT